MKIAIRTDNLDDLLKAKAKYGDKALILAGGTDVNVKRNRGLIGPEVIISISGITDMKGIVPEKGKLVIGSLSTHSDIENDAAVKRRAFPLHMSCAAIGSPQIRNTGTLGGNIGTASPAGDTLPSLVLLDSIINVMSIRGTRKIKAAKFFTGPGKTVLEKDEIIYSVEVPLGYTSSNSGFFKLGMRDALAISVLSVAWYFDKNGTVGLSFGGVSPVVKRILVKQGLSETAFRKKVSGIISPIDDIRAGAGFRRGVVTDIAFKVYRDGGI